MTTDRALDEKTTDELRTAHAAVMMAEAALEVARKRRGLIVESVVMSGTSVTQVAEVFRVPTIAVRNMVRRYGSAAPAH